MGQLIWYPQENKVEEAFRMDVFEFHYVMGHVEVYDPRGVFCFSADNMAEAMEELREDTNAA